MGKNNRTDHKSQKNKQTAFFKPAIVIFHFRATVPYPSLSSFTHLHSTIIEEAGLRKNGHQHHLEEKHSTFFFKNKNTSFPVM